MKQGDRPNRGLVVASVAAAFVLAGLALTQFGQQSSEPTPFKVNPANVAPVQTFIPDASGRYVADNMEDPKFSTKRVTLHCFATNPVALVSGRQIQLDLASGDTRYITRDAGGAPVFSPAPLAVGADIREACALVRQDSDATPAVNRMVGKLGL